MIDNKTKSSKLMALIKILGVGESFYTTVSQKYVQSYATKFKVKVHTEAVLLVENYGKEPKTIRAIKVTILPKQ